MSDLFAVQFDADSQVYRVSGEMTLASAREVQAETRNLFAQAAKMDIDLAHVTRADSAGLALLVSWMRQAKQAEKTISFQHVPSQMLAIAKASGLDEILPLK
jgi:phospholipid transport system transporter-binding protein